MLIFNCVLVQNCPDWYKLFKFFNRHSISCRRHKGSQWKYGLTLIFMLSLVLVCMPMYISTHVNDRYFLQSKCCCTWRKLNIASFHPDVQRMYEHTANIINNFHVSLVTILQHAFTNTVKQKFVDRCHKNSPRKENC